VKEVFIKYDSDKQGGKLIENKVTTIKLVEKEGVTKENLLEIMKSLMEDECIIGKVPNLQPHEIPTLFDAWDITEEKKC